MSLKIAILSLSENLKWKNWPTWIKGLFIFWPSLGPAYLFLTRTPFPTGGANEVDILVNIEYQNYLIAVFIGLWSINLLILGLTWTIGSLISDGYRYYLRSKSRDVKSSLSKKEKGARSLRMMKKGSTSAKNKNSKKSTETVKKIKKRYPVLKKKSASSNSSKSDKVE